MDRSPNIERYLDFVREKQCGCKNKSRIVLESLGHSEFFLQLILVL